MYILAHILQRKYFQSFLLICLTLFLVVVMSGSGVTAEKTPSLLTISTLPPDPTPDHSYRILGKLTAPTGEPLGNKRVILESLLSVPDENTNFSFVAIQETSRTGEFSFLRQKASYTEFYRITYKGGDLYEPAVSQVISINGEDPSRDNPGRVGSLVVSTNPTGAGIYIDYVFHGTTPNRIGGLPEGSHILEVALDGYQNETMEVYITPDRGTSFDISLNPAWLGLTKTGLSSTLTYTQNTTEPSGTPDFSLNLAGLSMNLYGNSSNNSTSSDKPVKVTTLISEDAIDGGYDVMVIMTDH